MKIHEYQAKQLLKKFQVSISPGQVAYTGQGAMEAAKSIGGNLWVVKAQIHAGGRGKGGGVKVAKSLGEVKEVTDKMIGMTLVTPQTGPQGRLVRRVYIEKGCSIDQELYLAMLLERSAGRFMIVASSVGGMDIEEVATHSPDKIHKISIDPALGFHRFQGRDLAFSLGIKGKIALKFAQVVQGLYDCFQYYDASLIEINPLVITKEGEIVALDAKMTFDENALSRHPDIQELRDVNEEDPAEYEANKNSLSYIKLDGNIGCLVNGAGLAMATMDAIKLYGGNPANFLDVGGGATRERVTEAFKLIISDRNVEGILVNIFGGIMRCDIIAEGIIAAAQDCGLNVPLVVRLEGTHVELGKDILAKSGLPILAANNLGDAAQQIVQAVKEVS